VVKKVPVGFRAEQQQLRNSKATMAGRAVVKARAKANKIHEDEPKPADGIVSPAAKKQATQILTPRLHNSLDANRRRQRRQQQPHVACRH
jgi:hypothetical protein